MSFTTTQTVGAGAGVTAITGGAFASVPNAEPKVPISALKNLPAGYSTKLGDSFKSFFLSVEGDDNSSFWTERARLIVEGKTLKALISGSFFSSVKSRETTSTPAQKLKEACSTAYKTDLISQETDLSKFEEVWEYCSNLGKVPVTLAKSTDPDVVANLKAASTGTAGKWNGKLGEGSKAYLISPEKSNDWYWEVRNEDFKDGSLSLTTSEKYYVKQEKPDLKQKCEDSYVLDKENTSSQESKPSKSEALKFCSFAKSN